MNIEQQQKEPYRNPYYDEKDESLLGISIRTIEQKAKPGETWMQAALRISGIEYQASTKETWDDVFNELGLAVFQDED